MPEVSRVYIAGPMRGYSRWNFDAFDRAEELWKEAGWDVISPAQIDRALGIDPDGPPEQIDKDFAWRAIQLDMVLLKSAHAIALLPGWQGSSGTTVELSLALFLGLPVYDAETMQRKPILNLPWCFTQKETHCT